VGAREGRLRGGGCVDDGGLMREGVEEVGLMDRRGMGTVVLVETSAFDFGDWVVGLEGL